MGCGPRDHRESDPTEATWLTHTDAAAAQDALRSVDVCNPTSYDAPPARRMSFLFFWLPHLSCRILVSGPGTELTSPVWREQSRCAPENSHKDSL